MSFQDIIANINFDKIKLSDKFSEIINSSSQEFLKMVSTWVSSILNTIIQSITALPAFCIYVGITLISTYFICTDKLYMLDQVEHHLPRTWVKRLMLHLRSLVSSLGCYLKAEFILVGISFVITLVRFIYNEFHGNECRISASCSHCNRIC